jgi:hypothetical protein
MTCPGCGWWHDRRRLNWAIWAIGQEPASVTSLPDHVLGALNRWCGGTNPVLTAEIERRYGTGTRLPRWFR